MSPIKIELSEKLHEFSKDILNVLNKKIKKN